MKPQRKRVDKNKLKHSTEEDDSEQYRPFSLYIILFCGLFIFCSGLYLVISKNLLEATTLPNNRFGNGGGNTVFLNGYGLIIIGFALGCFPALQLVKRGLRKRK